VFRVLLVCTGNICRSPLAQGFLEERSRRLLGGALHVRSAGTWARPGYGATDEAVAVAAERSIDIAEHRTTSFTAELADWADLVVTMTAEQRDEVAEAAPSTTPKTFTLKELVPILAALPPVEAPPSRDSLLARIAEADRLRREGTAPRPADEDVADPLGLGMEAYRAAAWEIEELIDATVRGLAGQPVAAEEA
jgi:protein-tyrosine phosphatase